MRGLKTKGMFAELFGKEGASSKGKGGSMHYYNSKRFFYGGNGIVGDQIPLATGLAFSIKYNKNPNRVAVGVYGDGTSDQGQVFEAANMAKLFNLPVIYFCENNKYSMGTSVERHSAGGNDLHRKFTFVPGM